VTLSNGSAEVADWLLSKADIRGELEHLLTVGDAGAWKPARATYAYAARACSVGSGEMLLVAVHPWDISRPCTTSHPRHSTLGRRPECGPQCPWWAELSGLTMCGRRGRARLGMRPPVRSRESGGAT